MENEVNIEVLMERLVGKTNIKDFEEKGLKKVADLTRMAKDLMDRNPGKTIDELCEIFDKEQEMAMENKTNENEGQEMSAD